MKSGESGERSVAVHQEGSNREPPRRLLVAIRQDRLDGAEPYTGLQLGSKGLGQLTVFVSGAHSDLCLRVDVVAACVCCARKAVVGPMFSHLIDRGLRRQGSKRCFFWGGCSQPGGIPSELTTALPFDDLTHCAAVQRLAQLKWRHVRLPLVHAAAHRGPPT